MVTNEVATAIELLKESPFSRYVEGELREFRAGIWTRKSIRRDEMVLRAIFERLENKAQAEDPGVQTPIQVLAAGIADEIGQCHYSPDIHAVDVVVGYMVGLASRLQELRGLGLVEAAETIYKAISETLTEGY